MNFVTQEQNATDAGNLKKLQNAVNTQVGLHLRSGVNILALMIVYQNGFDGSFVDLNCYLNLRSTCERTNELSSELSL